jgi:hypothetical protein
MRTSLFRVTLCAVMLLTVPSFAQAGEIASFLKQNVCAQATSATEYCNMYVDYLIGKGMDRKSAINSGYQDCGKLESSKAPSCKMFFDAAKNSSSGDNTFFDKTDKQYCSSGSDALYNQGCVGYWTLRFNIGLDKQTSLTTCDSQCTTYMKTMPNGDHCNKSCKDMNAKDN